MDYLDTDTKKRFLFCIIIIITKHFHFIFHGNLFLWKRGAGFTNKQNIFFQISILLEILPLYSHCIHISKLRKTCLMKNLFLATYLLSSAFKAFKTTARSRSKTKSWDVALSNKRPYWNKVFELNFIYLHN